MITVNEFYDHVYCLNLDRRPERWKASREELDKFNIKAERFPATDGHMIENNTRLSNGALGIIESHRRIIVDAIDHHYESILILEDDIMFNESFPERFDTAAREMPAGWSMFYLGANIQHFTPRPVTEHIHRVWGVLATHSIAISSDAYHFLLSNLNHTCPLDVQYNTFTQFLRMYIAIPRMTYQRPGFSDIEMYDVDYYFLKEAE